MTERGFYLDSLVRRAHEAVGVDGYISGQDLQRLSYLIRWSEGRQILGELLGVRVDGLQDIKYLFELQCHGLIDLHGILETEELRRFTQRGGIMPRIDTSDGAILTTLQLVRLGGDSCIGVFTKLWKGVGGAYLHN